MASKKNSRTAPAENILPVSDYTGKRLHSPEPPKPDSGPVRGTFPEKVPMGEYIKKYRKEAKISQKDLADKLHVTRNTVINWEAGKYRPDADLFPSLCSILEISLNDLFGILPDPADGFSGHEREMVRRYRLISPVSRKIVDRLITGILDEEIQEKDRILDESAHTVAVISTAAAAGDGFDYSSIPVEDYRFVFRNGRNEKADAIIRVKGDSMLPVYEEGDWVYVEYTPSASVGEDVICSSRAGFHIKRLGESGPYSVNKDAPFTLTGEDDRVEIVGRVLGIVNPSDYPSRAENDSLREIRRDEIKSFKEKYGLTDVL